MSIRKLKSPDSEVRFRAELSILSGLDKSTKLDETEHMKNFSAGDAKNKFGLMIDTARLEPVVIEKHGRPVAVVCSVEEFARLRRVAGESPPDEGEASG